MDEQYMQSMKVKETEREEEWQPREKKSDSQRVGYL